MTTTNTDRAATIQDRPPNFRDESGHLFLVRCFNCESERGRENYALAVAVGVCPECGWRDKGSEQPKYEQANPLGGLANQFEVMAGRIRAGERYEDVLADYGLQKIGG